MIRLLMILCCICSSLIGEHNLVFVHIGPTLPRHIIYSVLQARLFNPGTSIYVLSNGQSPCIPEWEHLDIKHVPIESLAVSQEHKIYNSSTQVTGFWRFALERFLVLDDFITQYNLAHIFHIENDIMIYCELEPLSSKLEEDYPNMVATTFDCDERAVPGFVYISNAHVSHLLASFIAKNAYRNTTDMEMLNLFRLANRKIYADSLPILIPKYAEDYPLTNIFKQTAQSAEPFTNHLDHLGMIFDAAALGQYLGGIDPILGESKSGFQGEASVFLPMHFDFKWIQNSQGLWIPYISYRGIEYPIANLHIHSKRLDAFLSTCSQMPAVPTAPFSSLPYDHIRPRKKK